MSSSNLDLDSIIAKTIEALPNFKPRQLELLIDNIIVNYRKDLGYIEYLRTDKILDFLKAIKLALFFKRYNKQIEPITTYFVIYSSLLLNFT